MKGSVPASLPPTAALQREIFKFELRIRSRVSARSREIARDTISLFDQAIIGASSEAEIEPNVRRICKQLRQHFPRNLIIGNVCTAAKRAVKEELPNAEASPTSPLHRRRCFLDISKIQAPDEIPTGSAKASLRDAFDRLRNSIDTTYDAFPVIAENFLVSSEVILTLGESRSVVSFLSQHQPRATVVVLERAPEYDGWAVAKNLEAVGAEVIVIPDSAIFAIMPKVTKVIVSAHVVLANGGIVSYSLTHSIALAAKHHSKPFIALYWKLKLSKTIPGPGKVFTSLFKPVHLLQTEDQNAVNSVEINPDGDYVPPELITVLINGELSHCPGDVFSLVQEGVS